VSHFSLVGTFNAEHKIPLIRAPSIRSLKKAMQTYARQGGTSTIFINDDGLRVCY
jgi:hypothetical protein